ncbi:hypothetical protein DVH24_009743 [Malus domestica]|uniref:Uncharacterized protein n=1 Tax=Malus domestica TaxID=3750 RepID=A0A498JUN7_MALDO|nr:hypothetical protein DVH24_009743 [Malus domestica]
MCYKNNPSLKENHDPVKVIREALSRALVYYYPLAGRLREGPNIKLRVFADVTLEQLGDKILPPCPLLEEFLFNFPNSDGIIDCPLVMDQVNQLIINYMLISILYSYLVIAILILYKKNLSRLRVRVVFFALRSHTHVGDFFVTHLTCGGFILALRLNHTMCDAPGLHLFLNAIAEMARGEHAPSILPVWERELLITCAHHEYEDVIDHSDGSYASSNQSNMVQRSFYFGAKEMRVLRKQIPPHLISTCSTFDLITASPKINPKQAKAKATMNEAYLRSVADLLVLRGRPQYSSTGSYLIVSDKTRAGFGDVNFGWGQPVFAGPSKALDLISF